MSVPRCGKMRCFARGSYRPRSETERVVLLAFTTIYDRGLFRCIPAVRVTPTNNRVVTAAAGEAMSKFTFLKPGVTLIEMTPVPIRHIDDIGRIDIIDDTVIVTLFENQPGEGGTHDSVVVDKIALRCTRAVDMVQFFLSAMAQAGVKVGSRKPLVLQ